jgi:hypothetical protein
MRSKRGGGMRAGGVQNTAKKGRLREKNLEGIKDVWKPCNPLRSHKTAKDLFGKAWSKTRDFWRSLEKGLEAPLFRHRWLPLTSGLSINAGSLLRGAKRRSKPRGSVTRPPGLLRCASRPSAKSGLSTEKRKARSSKGTGWRTVRNAQ